MDDDLDAAIYRIRVNRGLLSLDWHMRAGMLTNETIKEVVRGQLWTFTRHQSAAEFLIQDLHMPAAAAHDLLRELQKEQEDERRQSSSNE